MKYLLLIGNNNKLVVVVRKVKTKMKSTYVSGLKIMLKRMLWTSIQLNISNIYIYTIINFSYK